MSENRDFAAVPGRSIKKVLDQNDMTLDDVELIEINEAVAAVAVINARSVLKV